MTRFTVSGITSTGAPVVNIEIDANDPEEAGRKLLEQSGWAHDLWIHSIVEPPEVADGHPIGNVIIKSAGVFGADVADPHSDYIHVSDWSRPVQYFVGRNGSGKSKTANAIAAATGARILTTDRLVGLMNFDNYGWGVKPASYKGVPLGEEERSQMLEFSRASGLATSELFALREEPDVLLRVAAFLRRALGRTIELRENAGFLDPFVRMGTTEYSLLRDEGHGLRELVVLLAAVYRNDWGLLIVDEAELHLHPSMARLWLGELNRVCESTGRCAIVVTHEPTFLRPKSAEDLASIWVFSVDSPPRRVIDCVLDVQKDRVAASLAQNPQLISEIVFSPRPVLLEGITDVAAMSTALSRLAVPEVVAQTDLVDCGGSGGVALWLEICIKLGLDVRAVCDLDALFDRDMQRTINSLPGLSEAITAVFTESPGAVSTVLRPLIREADRMGIEKDPVSRAAWLAELSDETSAESMRKSRLLELLAQYGLWVHPQGTLEKVLGISNKGIQEARAAASIPGGIDLVANWSAYQIDLHGDVRELLGIAVERIAHSIMEAMRESPSVQFVSTVGASAQSDAKLARVIPLADGCYRLEVIAPKDFQGWWLEFSRNTVADDLILNPPC